MNEEEYKNRINKINARLSTDRCSDDEIANLNIQRIYLKDKYIDYVEKELKDKDEKISKVIEIIRNDTTLNPQRQRDRLINILESNIQDLKSLKGE